MHALTSELPYLTADVPGVGGMLRETDSDFQVEEIPMYQPSGYGDHVFAWIEKRGLATPVAAERMARELGVRSQDVGWAGMKDRHAVTRQYLSFPPPCLPESVQALDLPGIAVLTVARHRHKLRTGHLRGNRFTIRVRNTEIDADAAAERTRDVLARLSRPPGNPNWFGPQRFGRDGDNAEIGRSIVTGTGPRGRMDGRKRRLYISALQSLLFNEYLRRRLVDGLLDRVIEGDVLQKRNSGGIFVSTESEVDQERLEAGDVVPTGPIFGHRCQRPHPESAAAVREDQVLAAAGVDVAAFARVGKLGTGTRRPLAVELARTAVSTLGERAIELSFALPAGAYATAVLREVVKGANPFPG